MTGQHVLASNNFLVPNATFIAEFIAFVLILGIIARYILPPVQKAMRERQAIIRQQMEDADQAREKLAEAQSAYDRALGQARSEAAEIRENARAEAQRNVEEMRTQAQEEAARIVARGEEQLVRQRGALVRELRAEIGTLAVELSQKIVGEHLADNSQVSATVDRFITQLDAKDGSSEAPAKAETPAGSST